MLILMYLKNTTAKYPRIKFFSFAIYNDYVVTLRLQI